LPNATIKGSPASPGAGSRAARREDTILRIPKPFTARVARWCAAHPESTVVCWLVYTALAVFAGHFTSPPARDLSEDIAPDPARLLGFGIPVVAVLLVV